MSVPPSRVPLPSGPSTPVSHDALLNSDVDYRRANLRLAHAYVSHEISMPTDSAPPPPPYVPSLDPRRLALHRMRASFEQELDKDRTPSLSYRLRQLLFRVDNCSPFDCLKYFQDSFEGETDERFPKIYLELVFLVQLESMRTSVRSLDALQLYTPETESILDRVIEVQTLLCSPDHRDDTDGIFGPEYAKTKNTIHTLVEELLASASGPGPSLAASHYRFRTSDLAVLDSGFKRICGGLKRKRGWDRPKVDIIYASSPTEERQEEEPPAKRRKIETSVPPPPPPPAPAPPAVSVTKKVKAKKVSQARVIPVTPSTVPLFLSTISYSDVHAGHPDAVPSPTLNLQAVVTELNALISAQKIKFVVVTGDLTNSAQQADFEAVEAQLSRLTVPYFPAPGGHDILRLHPSSGTYINDGLKSFVSLFSSQTVSHPWIRNSTANTTLYNPTANIEDDVLINYEFVHGDACFFVVDWISRLSTSFVSTWGTNNGPHRHASLHDYSGGTMAWLRERLEFLEADSSISRAYLVQHHPFEYPIFVEEQVYGWVDADSVSNKLLTLGPVLATSDKLQGNFAGHMHEFYDNTPFVYADYEGVIDSPSWREVVTEDLKSGARYTIVKFDDGSDGFSIEKVGYDLIHRDLLIYGAIGGVGLGFVCIVLVFLGLILCICIKCCQKRRKKRKVKPIKLSDL